MTLPFTSDYPLVPSRQWSPFEPPFVPQLSLPPDVMRVLPLVCSAVANEAGARSTASPVRMFLYNLLSSYNWNNPNYAQVVQLTSDMVALALNKKSVRSAEECVVGAASHALHLFSSEVLFQYPDLKSLVAPDVLEAARNNIPILNNLKQEIMNMYNNQGYPGQPPQAWGPPQQAWGQPQQNWPQAQTAWGPQQAPWPGQPNAYPGNPNQQWGGNRSAGNGSVQGGSGWSNRGNYNHGNQPEEEEFQDSRFKNQTQPQTQRNAQPQVADVQIKRTYEQTRIEPVGDSRYPPQRSASEQSNVSDAHFVELHDEPAATASTQILTIFEGSEMAHSRSEIKFFGQSYRVDSLFRSKKQEESVAKLARSSISFDDNAGENMQIYQKIMLEPGIDRAITTSRAKRAVVQKLNSSNEVFRCFSAVVTVIPVATDVQPFMQAFQKQDLTFLGLSNKIRSIGASLESKRPEDANRIDAIVAFIAEIDLTITGLVNDFLVNRLDNMFLIETFVGDIAELETALTKDGGKKAIESYRKFEQLVMETVFSPMSEEEMEAVASYFETSDDLYYAYLPIPYSFTYTFLTNSELGLQLSTKAMIIDEKTAPSLHLLASSLVRHKKESNVNTVFDLLITAEGVRYRLYQSGLDDNKYLISHY